MESYSQGTLVGAGTFRCRECSFAVALQERDRIPTCPHCGSESFERSSLFGEHRAAEPWGAVGPYRPDWLDDARERVDRHAPHLALRDETDEISVIPLEAEWTRLGRSLSAQIHLDDPTISRRHALFHRLEGGTRVLDDRSLNGVFVNGERVEARELDDGDEVAVGRFYLYFLDLAPERTHHLFAAFRRT
jgi:predicted RNA-binding Zn-ribbon protein involved in translation (DUF1610 family)